jgi:hypothetical protein
LYGFLVSTLPYDNYPFGTLTLVLQKREMDVVVATKSNIKVKLEKILHIIKGFVEQQSL